MTHLGKQRALRRATPGPRWRPVVRRMPLHGREVAGEGGVVTLGAMPVRPRRSVALDRERRAGQRSRILDAARDLLESKPWAEVTVNEVMAAAGQSRTIFYRYFGDRQSLLLALMEGFTEEMATLGEDWLRSDGDVLERLQADLDRLVELFAAHGSVLRAIAMAADEDPDVSAAYSAMAERFIDITAQRIRMDVAGGASDVEDPEEVARALVWSTERYLVKSFGEAGAPARIGEVKHTLRRLWLRTIYGATGAPRRSGRGGRRGSK